MGCGPSQNAAAVPAMSRPAKRQHSNSNTKTSPGINNGTVDARQRNIGEDLRLILEGDMTKKCPSNAKIVRIFTSSTFTDTQHERNALMERVYPKLKKFCQERGYEFQVVDMRWGVRDEATDDHMTTELCLREVEACQKVSTGPNFVTFLSEKYGYMPLPRKIPDDEMQLMYPEFGSGEKSLIESWYKMDENEIPTVYVLQAVSTNLPGYKSEDANERETAKSKWWDTMSKMRQMIVKAAEKVLEQSALVKYKHSVTALEIEKGILGPHGHQAGTFWFHRILENMGEEDQSDIRAAFAENSDSDAGALLGSLKDKLQSVVPSDNIVTYNVEWTDTGVNPDDVEDHRKYIDKLCGDFETSIRNQILAGITEHAQSDIFDPLVEEVIQHVGFSQSKCELFHGREETLQLIEDYIRNVSSSPLVVHGPSGSGKTSVVAMAAKLAREWLSDDAAVILRFLGTTPDSSNIRRVLYSVVQQINKVYGDDTKVPEDMKLLIRSLRENLLKATAERPLVILLDSLDQLDPDDGARQLSWLPTDLPAHVKIILSTLPEEEYEYYPRLRSILPDDQSFVAVPKLAQKDTQEILDQWLADQNRRLSEAQMETVVSACQQCPLPLFLKISFDEACRWYSYSKPEETHLKITVRDAIIDLFERVERNHGKVLVSRALGYMTTGKNGVTENELEDILSLDDDVLNDVYQYWTPPIRRLPPLLWVRIRAELSPYLVDRGADGSRVINWYHRQFIEAAADRYVGDEKTKAGLHAVLAEYFIGTWANGVKKPYVSKGGEKGESDRLVAAQPMLFEEHSYNLRKLNELPYHLMESNQLQVLKDTALCNLEWLGTKMKGTSLRNVLEDFAAASNKYPKDEEIKSVFQLIRLSQDALTNDPAQLASQLLARTSKTKGMEKLLEQAKNPPFPCLLPSVPFMTPPGGQLLNTLAGHGEMINSLDITADGSMIISGDDNHTFKLWDVESGFLIKSVDSEEELKKVGFCNDDKHFAVSYGSTIKIFRSDTIAEVRTLTPYGDDPDSAEGVQFALAGEKREKVVVPCQRKVVVYDAATGTRVGSYVDLKLLREYYEDAYIDARGDIVAYYNENLEKRWNMVGVINLAADDRKAGIVEVYPDVTIDEDGDEQRTQVNALAVTRDKRIVVSEYQENDLKIYDAVSLELLQTLKGNKSDFSQYFYVSQDDRYLVFPNSTSVCVWDLQTAERAYFAEHPNSIEKAVSVDGTAIVTAASDNLIRIWDITRADSSKDLTQRDWEFHKGAQGGRKIKPKVVEKKKDGKKGGEEEDNEEKIIDLLTIPNQGRNVISLSKQGKLYAATIWDCISMKPLLRLAETAVGSNRKFDWQIIDHHLAISMINRRIKLIDYTTGEILRVFKGKLSYSDQYIVNNRTEVVTATRHSRNLKIYDIATGNVVHILRHSEEKKTKESTAVEDYKAKSDGDARLVVSKLEEDEQHLYVWDIPNRKLRHRLNLPMKEGVEDEEKGTLDLMEFGISSDEHFLCCNVYYKDEAATPSPGVWDLNTGQYLYTLSHESAGSVNAMKAVGTDKLLTSYYDNTKAIWMWSLLTGEPLIKLPGHRRLEVDKLLVSDDERRLLSYTSGSEEREFIVWDLVEGKRLAGFTLEETNDIQFACSGDVIVVVANSIGSIVTFTLNGPGIEKVLTPLNGPQVYKDSADVVPFNQNDGVNDEKEDPDDIDSDEDSADEDDEGDVGTDKADDDDDDDDGDNDDDDWGLDDDDLDKEEADEPGGDGDNDGNDDNDDDDSWNFSSDDDDDADDNDLDDDDIESDKKKKRKKGKAK